MTNIAVLASFNMDLVMRAERRPDAGETLQGTFAMHLGGKGFNQAVAARRLGAAVRVAGRVGDDEFGSMFLVALDREGIDRRAVTVDPHEGTGVASIVVEPDGTNTIIQAPRANRAVSAGDWRAVPDWFAGVDVALASLETNAPTAIDFFADAHAFDARTLTMLNAAPAGQVPDALMAMSSVLVVNAIEAAHMLKRPAACDIQAADAMAAALASNGRTVVVTLGDAGAVAVAPSGRAYMPAFEVSVVDTTGAGDAFCGALGLALPGATLADALRFASAAGAVACTRHGAEPAMPELREVEALLATGATRPVAGPS